MHLDVVAHHELHPRQPDSVGGNSPPAKGGGRIGEVEHYLRSGGRDIVEIEHLRLVVRSAFVNEALIAFGAGHRHFLFAMKQVSGVASADDRRQTQLAAHDGGV